MKSTLLALITVAALGSGAAVAQDAMSSPMQGNAMASDMMMTPDQMMAMCIEKAGMATDAMMKADNEKACHTVHDLLMSDAMMSQPMAPDAMAPNAMSGAAMAPAQ